MFTGIIEGIGQVRAIRRLRNEMELTVSPLFEMSDCRLGESVSVDGVCLTVTAVSEGSICMDVSGETLSRSTVGLLKPGDKVNLERALRLSDRLGGHIVAGHVDGIGKIVKREARDQKSWRLKIAIEEKVSRYTIEKGSISVDGISLTINRCDQKAFEVNIIPQTGRETTLLAKKVGDLVNIETDFIGKYVEKFCSRDHSRKIENTTESRIDLEMLMKKGFGD
ncbi:MAG: riboflavin synthase [Desulfatiglandaceae bacterium]|mgnify:CR=1 FL=1